MLRERERNRLDEATNSLYQGYSNEGSEQTSALASSDRVPDGRVPLSVYNSETNYTSLSHDELIDIKGSSDDINPLDSDMIGSRDGLEPSPHKFLQGGIIFAKYFFSPVIYTDMASENSEMRITKKAFTRR
jgi:hypothetical protein